MYNCYIAECSKAAAVSPCPNTAPNPWPHPSMHRFTCTEEDRKKNMFFTHTHTEFSHSRKTSCVVFFAKGLCTCVCVCFIYFSVLSMDSASSLNARPGRELVPNSTENSRYVPANEMLFSLLFLSSSCVVCNFFSQ